MLLLGGYIFAFFYSVKITRWGPQVEYHNLKIKKTNQFRFAFVQLHPFYYGSIRAGWGYYFIISS